jgi:hypothetical protein
MSSSFDTVTRLDLDALRTELLAAIEAERTQARAEQAKKAFERSLLGLKVFTVALIQISVVLWTIQITQWVIEGRP